MSGVCGFEKLELMRKKLDMDGAFDEFKNEKKDEKIVESHLSSKAIADIQTISPTIYGYYLWSERHGGTLAQFMDLAGTDDAGIRHDIQRLTKKMNRKQVLRILEIAYEMILLPELMEMKSLLQTKPIDHVLTIDEADELGSYFSKRELVSLAMEKYGFKEADSLKIIELLIKMSESGSVPVQPYRFIKCKRCSKPVDCSPIKIIPFLELEQKGRYCPDCDEYIKKLNVVVPQSQIKE